MIKPLHWACYVQQQQGPCGCPSCNPGDYLVDEDSLFREALAEMSRACGRDVSGEYARVAPPGTQPVKASPFPSRLHVLLGALGVPVTPGSEDFAIDAAIRVVERLHAAVRAAVPAAAAAPAVDYEAICTEAGQAGDHETVALCLLAMYGKEVYGEDYRDRYPAAAGVLERLSSEGATQQDARELLARPHCPCGASSPNRPERAHRMTP